MTTVNLPEAQEHLAELIDKAVSGESFIIAKAGKPLVKVTALEPLVTKGKRRIGFMDGQFKVPDDFDTMCQDEIIALFEGDE